MTSERPGPIDGVGWVTTAMARLDAEMYCRWQEINTLLEPLRKLVEGRYAPDCRDRSEEFHANAGQWTVWLTSDEHENYKDLLDALSADVETFFSNWEARDAA